MTDDSLIERIFLYTYFVAGLASLQTYVWVEAAPAIVGWIGGLYAAIAGAGIAFDENERRKYNRLPKTKVLRGARCE